MSNNRERAKRLLKNYLRYGVKASGLKWDSDNDAEVEDIVDCLIDAVKDELAAEMSDSGEQFLIIHLEEEPL
jgi:hypothetical protein